MGSRAFIDVRTNPWIPAHESFRLTDPQQVPQHIQSVAHLLLQDLVRWDRDKLVTHFSSRDANAILELLLTQTGQEDALYWFYEKRGSFSIKNAYELAWGIYIHDQIQSDHRGYQRYNSLHNKSDWWKRLWKFKIMPRIKVFSW